ncbi:MAG: hypothetical protein JXK92_05385, partial [Erysipelotrichaceae bacterium]|nr:hypothetical protein [Erysipelotrichaceae bacterium]
LAEYNGLLESELDIEFVGTRLHGGIRALQLKRRTFIVAVDNRAIEKHKDFNIPVLLREDCDKLDDILTQPVKTEITIPMDKINEWKSQFKR